MGHRPVTQRHSRGRYRKKGQILVQGTLIIIIILIITTPGNDKLSCETKVVKKLDQNSQYKSHLNHTLWRKEFPPECHTQLGGEWTQVKGSRGRAKNGAD
jgi:hypothetical protein